MQKTYPTKRSDYFYELPTELIAQYPKQKRETSRLMVLDRDKSEIIHKIFTDIIDYLHAGDVLVVNNTKVIPARLFGHKETGAKVEVFLLDQLNDNQWKCLVKPGRKLKPGSKVIFSETFRAQIKEVAEEGSRIVEFEWSGDFWKNLDQVGKIPLPPYITRESELKDKETYQTVYSKEKGSVAAPTAGLHFTDEVLVKLKNKGVEILEVMLHVGLGTFRPVKSDSILEHKMHSEYCQISEETATKINLAKSENRRIISVGTTSTRTLESFAKKGKLEFGSRWTDIFIYPGKNFQIIDGLLTNFHMPESTLMMLVSAFADYDFIMKAYKMAVQEKYRFFSYGDAMLIV